MLVIPITCICTYSVGIITIILLVTAVTCVSYILRCWLLKILWVRGYQGSHYILVLKFKDFSRTLKLHFQGPILDGSLQHEQYYSNI